MPTSVNGIGTHYYGKKNRQTRRAVCRNCGANTILESYDTILWVIFAFIPVIPLGRKRIIDQCANCSRHWVVKLSQWEMSRQLNVSGAMEEYRTQPSWEAALKLHASLLGFHLHDEARQFREEAMAQYADSAALLAGLAAQMEQAGAFSEVVPLFEKALALRPDLPEARVGVAMARIRAGSLDEARELLSFLEEPGAGQSYSLAPLETLAQAYQRAGRHEDTLALCKHLLAELPSVGQIHGFRRFIAASERAARRSESMLPKRTFSLRGLFDRRSGTYAPWQRWLAVGAIAGALFLLGLGIANEYRRRHRTVFAVNDFGQTVQVAIDGGAATPVDSLGKIELSEGRHHVSIKGPIEEEFDVEMRSSYFQRWTSSPIWVINVGGVAALMEETLYYAANPRPSEGRGLFGEKFCFFPHVDYAFEDPPQKLRVEGKNAQVVKTHVARVPVPADRLFAHAVHSGDRETAFRFAEARLRQSPEDGSLLRGYVEAAKDASQTGRAEQFLKTGLWRTPLSVVWHRAYQDLDKAGAREAELARQYDAQLQKQPRDARLLYLRGRVTGPADQAQEFFRKSRDADPALGWPWLALAFDAASEGDWAQARSLADKAGALNVVEPNLRWLRHVARLATGDAKALEAECRQRIQVNPLGDGVRDVIDLCDALVVQGRAEQVRQALSEWEARLSPNVRSGGLPGKCRHVAAYMLGDFASLPPGALSDADVLEFRLHVLAATGRARDAAQDQSLAKVLQEPWNALALSLSFGLAGDEREAGAWRERACAAMDREDDKSKRAAALLRSPNPPSAKQLSEIVMSPNAKSLVLAALAGRFPSQKAELAAMARRLNVSRMPPYHLVQKATEVRR